MVTEYDIAIIGGGILGLATALAMSDRRPRPNIVVVEKEAAVAHHQSGRNSGVIHSGLYYRPGSLKARLCVAGAERMIRFCEERGVPFTRDGKLVVATSEGQLPALAELERRGRANGLVGLRRIEPGELREIEPDAAGIAALHVPGTGAVDFGEVSRAMAGLLEERGVPVTTSFRVVSIVANGAGVTLESAGRSLTARGIVNCGGLYSDRLAIMAGLDPPVQIIPFRGEYYDVGGYSAGLVRSSIYPVPDPGLPFLGIHLTRSVDGSVHAGPNAVLAGAREGYRWRSVRAGELWRAISYPGFLRLASRHWRAGIAEVARSVSKRRFAASVRQLVPGIDVTDLHRGATGVRAQAVTRAGELHDDFLVLSGPRSVHVLNAPSPAATASLVIGDYLASKVDELLDVG